LRREVDAAGPEQRNTSNDKCNELLDMVRSILDLSGAFCCLCNKSHGKKEIKRCNGCNRMTYCSKTCQREDWLSGHNLTCFNKLFTEEQSGKFQGRVHPVLMPENDIYATKLEALEQNFNMIQLKLFLDNSKAILSQARELNIPLHDCVVQFDIRYCPPTVEVMRYSEHSNSPEGIKCFEDTRSREDITCIYISWIYHGWMKMEISLGL